MTNNPHVKIRAEIDTASKTKIRKILKYYKLNQKQMCDEIAAVLIKNMSDDGMILLSPNLIAEIRQDMLTLQLGKDVLRDDRHI